MPRRHSTTPHQHWRLEVLERRELLASLICDGPAGTWQGEPGSQFVRWCPDLQFPSPSSLATADFNNDGMLDLVVGTNDQSQNLAVRIGGGDGTFTSMRRTGEAGQAISIATDDFDRDGWMDIIEANGTTEFVSVFRQLPDGTFEGPFGARFNNVRAVATTGVMNCGSRGQVAIAHDFDTGSPNGIVRLACVDNLYSGGIHFGMVPIWAEVNPGPRALVPGDFIPGSGSQEVLVVNGSGTVQVVGYNGAWPGVRSTITVGDSPTAATAADFDSDGRLDVALANHGNGRVTVLLNHNELVVSEQIGGMGPAAIATTDWNSDGHADLLVAGWQQEVAGDEFGYYQVFIDQLWVLNGLGDGTFDEPITFELGGTIIADEEYSGSYAGPSALAVADFNRDGKPDLAVAEPDNGAVVILLNQLGETDNEQPIANDDGWLTHEDMSVPIKLFASDAEGGAVTYRILAGPQYGTLSGFDPVSGDVMYTPDPNWHGLAAITFLAIDSDGLESEPATVHVRVDPVNDSPVLSPQSDVGLCAIGIPSPCNGEFLIPMAVPEDTVVEFDLCEFVVDVETPCAGLRFEVQGAANGEADLLDDGHTVMFLPDPEYTGPAAITIAVTDRGDPDGGDADEDAEADCDILIDPDCELFSPPITVELEIPIEVFHPNEPPVSIDGEASCVEDSACDFPLVADDPDGDEPTFRIVAPPRHGSMVEFDAATGELVYLPDSNYCGDDSLTFTANDSELDSNLATYSITIECVNDSPTVEDEAINISENGVALGQIKGHDVDEDVATYILVTEPRHGCVHVDPDTGEFLYSPHEDYFGIDQFAVQVDDNTGEENSLSNLATVSISVTPLEPGISMSGGALTINGTLGDDMIRLMRVPRSRAMDAILDVRASDGTVSNLATFRVPDVKALTSVLVRARGGDDTVNLASLPVQVSAEIHGGPGNDRITAGRGHDIVLGGTGNDYLNGGAGNDLLVGGADRDRLVGGSGSDLLLAGILDDPCRELDLSAVVAEWNRAESPDEMLAAAVSLFDWIRDDGKSDLNTGGTGTDLFVASELDRIIDVRQEDLSVRI